MKNSGRIILTILAAVICLSLGTAAPAAADQEGLKGWETDGEYNSHYIISDYDTFKGRVEKIFEVAPMKGMDPAVAMEVRDTEGEIIIVHVGPASFVKKDMKPVRPGARVKLRGAWAEIDGKEVFMMSRLNIGDDFQLKVRLTKDGTPFWTMTPEQVAKERAPE